MAYEKISYTVDGEGIATLALDDPETRNALSDELLLEMLEALHSARDDDAVRVVVLTSTHEKVFSAGGNLGGLRLRRADLGASGTAPATSSTSSRRSAPSASRRSSPPTVTCSPARWGSPSPAI